METAEKRKVLAIIALILVLCLWIVFFVSWYPEIREEMLGDIAKWESCGLIG